ncbi:MAG TPA: protein kinase [Gammaproteobacteria bacterium]|nr:protein kinase [Gammaproteobacteria bacterium]
MRLAAGTRFGPYEIVAPLGAGGMGEVYRARDTRLGRDVAIKVLPAHSSSEPNALARFEREARVIAALSHPNLIAIHDVGNVDGTAFAVMELLEGATLRDRLAAGEIGLVRGIDWALQVAQGLAAAHERDVVHRDLKPENVFITEDGNVKILDFGLARRATPEPPAPGGPKRALTGTGIVIGTVGYLSPEQTRGFPADHRSDIFAFGLLLYEVVTGRRAFDRETATETMAAVLRDEPPPIAECGRKVPSEVEEVIRHCLEKEPAQRFRSSRDLVFALRLAAGALSRAPPVSDGGAATAAVSRSPDASIAVLLFRSVGGGPESEYFSEGMTEDVIAALSTVPGVRVAARTSSFSFRGRSDDVRKIGTELGVATVLDGSVRQVGQRLRVTAQLIDVATGYNLWSERWDRDLADIFAVQDELARAIANTLRARLPGSGSGARPSGTDAPPPKLVAPATRDVAAYDHYLKGRYLWNRRRLHEAIAEIEAAVARDPDLHEAHAALAQAWAAWGFYGGISTWECWARARAAAERVEELASESESAALCYGVVDYYYGWSGARTERFFRLAIERNPGNAEAHFWLALYLGVAGRAEDGIASAREGVRLEPHSANNRAAVAWPLLSVRRYEEARAELEIAVALGDSPFALWSYGMTLSCLGRHEQAIAAHRQAVQVTGGRYTYYIALLANALAQGGRVDEARALLKELDDRALREYVPPFDRAVVLAGLRDDEATLDALERALQDRNAFLWARIHFPPLAGLAHLPRFRAIADQLARRAPIAT